MRGILVRTYTLCNAAQKEVLQIFLHNQKLVLQEKITLFFKPLMKNIVCISNFISLVFFAMKKLCISKNVL